VSLVKIFTSHQTWYENAPKAKPTQFILENLLKDDLVMQFIQVNRYHDVLWFNKEAFEQLLWWLFVSAVVRINADSELTENQRKTKIASCYKMVEQMQFLKEQSGYKVENLLETGNVPVKK